VRLAISPDEADSPLIVYANAVLSGSIAFERFQTVARRNAKLLQCFGGVQVEQPAPRRALDGLEPGHGPIFEKSLGVVASK